MTAPSKVSGSPRNTVRPHEVLKARRVEARRFAISDGAPVEVLESGPSVAARVATLASRLTIRPVLAVGSYVPNLPWPWGLIDLAARVLLPVSATVRETVKLAQCLGAAGARARSAARGRHPSGGCLLARRRVSDLWSELPRPAWSRRCRSLLTRPCWSSITGCCPSIRSGWRCDDCHDAYQWLRERGYQPDQIVLAGDSAGGYLALALAQRLQEEGRGAGGAGSDLATAAASKGIQAGASQHQDRRDVPRRRRLTRSSNWLLARPKRTSSTASPKRSTNPWTTSSPDCRAR